MPDHIDSAFLFSFDGRYYILSKKCFVYKSLKMKFEKCSIFGKTISKMGKKIYLLLYLLFSGSIMYAQTEIFRVDTTNFNAAKKFEINGLKNIDWIKTTERYIKLGINDIASTVSSPLYWQEKDWLTATVVLAGAGLLFTFDKPIYEFIQNYKNTASEDISKYILEPWGNNYSFVTIAAFGSYGILS